MSLIVVGGRRIPAFQQLGNIDYQNSPGSLVTSSFDFTGSPLLTGRRLLGIASSKRISSGGSTASLTSARFVNPADSGDFVTATVHVNARAGNSSANNAIGIYMVSALVPTNVHTDLELTFNNSINDAFKCTVLGIYKKTTISDIAGSATHTNGDNISTSVTNAAGDTVVVAACGLGGVTTSWDHGTERDDESSGSASLSFVADGNVGAQSAVNYKATFSSSVTALAIARAVFTS